MAPTKSPVEVGDDGREIVAIPTPNISAIKNKFRRRALYKKLVQEKNKVKKERQKSREEMRERLGDKAPPKEIPKTLENQRWYDETMVAPADEEVAVDEANDELAPYFNRETTPKVLITMGDSGRKRAYRFCHDLNKIIPNSTVKMRKHIALKKIVESCKEREYTDILVVNENSKTVNGLVLIHLPDGPTAHFKVSNVRLWEEMKKKERVNQHCPEVILNQFSTRLGHRVGRMLASLFPHTPQFQGRRVVTFHNQRDFIFFRQHRYQFRNAQRVGLKELGPRFTLKLRSLQKGTFDSKYGEYEWVHKRHEMETSRRKFFL